MRLRLTVRALAGVLLWSSISHAAPPRMTVQSALCARAEWSDGILTATLSAGVDAASQDSAAPHGHVDYDFFT